MLPLYERLGRLCVQVHAGERGAARMTQALDLADGVGRDDYAALFCRLRGELLAQANRTDESRDWLERAATFRG
jgi:predicted negative regulator of RcsB-dependent stress response